MLSPNPPTHSSTCKSYKFRQASDFWYLTGFEEPDSALILGKWSISLHHSTTTAPHTRACALHDRLVEQPNPPHPLSPPQRRTARRAASARSSTAPAKTPPKKNGTAHRRASQTSFRSSERTTRARWRVSQTTCALSSRAPNTSTSTCPLPIPIPIIITTATTGIIIIIIVVGALSARRGRQGRGFFPSSSTSRDSSSSSRRQSTTMKVTTQRVLDLIWTFLLRPCPCRSENRSRRSSVRCGA